MYIPKPRIAVSAIKRKKISRARYPPPLLVIFIDKVLLLETLERRLVSFASVYKTLSRKHSIPSQNGSKHFLTKQISPAFAGVARASNKPNF
jgi:hypothetical protein